MNESDARTLLEHPPDLRLDGRVAWLTGASRGLGRAVAYGLAGAGAQLLLTARSPDALTDLGGEIRRLGGVVETVAGSITDSDVLRRCADVIHARWGRLDVLINNAGISPAFVRSERLTDDTWHEVMEVNLFGPYACSRQALPLFEAAGGGSIVNVSSIHGSRAHQRLIAYAASKGGMEMITRTLAAEWAPRRIRVNSVAPGYLETEMTAGLREHARWSESLRARIPMGRFGTTSEVVPAVLFLAGPESSYITGTTLYIDGGWSAT